MKRLFTLLVALLFALLIAACGGGGGDGSLPVVNSPDIVVPPLNPGDAIPDVAAISVVAASPTIGTGGNTTVSVQLLNSTGQAMPYPKTVTFSLNNPGLATITPSASTSNGTISTPLTAKLVEGTVTVTASVDGQSDSYTVQISNQAAADTLTAVANPTTVTVGGTAVVSATVLDVNGAPMPNGTTVNFSLDNAALGTIPPTALIAGGAGVAQATFSAATNAAGTATITATSGAATGNATLDVIGADAGSIEFLSATPSIIALDGAGGQQTSTVQFLVKDSTGNPVVGAQTVILDLSGPSGPTVGEYIGPNPGVKSLPVGTQNGIATVILHSGIVPGTATITATVAGTNLKTSSGVIAIGGGIPSEGHFSLSTTILNLEGGQFDGIEAEITARIADRYSNYNVLQGTSVSFYSECGAIDRAVNLDALGAGTVIFRTQRPFPQDVSPSVPDAVIAANYLAKLDVTIDDTNNPSDGLCTIVAVIDGEEEFTDGNADGVYNSGETFIDTYDDIHIDKDDDPEDILPGDVIAGYPYDATFEDLVVDRHGNGVFDGMNGVWDENKRISRQLKLLFTGIPDISVAIDGTPAVPVLEGDMVSIPDGGSTKLNFAIHDGNFNPPIVGTSFTVSADVGGLSGKTTYTYLDTSVTGAPIFSVTIFDSNPGDADPPELGTLTFTWNWKGADYTFSTPLQVN